jgi:hypothetical protein
MGAVAIELVARVQQGEQALLGRGEIRRAAGWDAVVGHGKALR